MNSTKSQEKICENCYETFKKKPGTHGRFCSLSCSNLFREKIYRATRQYNYYLDPKLCLHCDHFILYEKKANRFCSHSCSGFYTGKRKGPMSEETKKKISVARKKKILIAKKKKTKLSKKLYSIKCHGCDEYFLHTCILKTCSKICKNKSISRKMKIYVSKNPNHKYNRNPYKQSYMERTFEEWLVEQGYQNNRKGYLCEITFKNRDTNKYCRVDFLFPKLKIVIELDGTHHLDPKRMALDKIRDQYLKKKGYNVIRISHKEYTKKLRVEEIKKLLGL